MTMTMTRTIPSFLALLLGAMALLGAARAAVEDKTPSPDPAAGQLLVASRAIGDPRFRHSVILLLRHDEDGAFGVMINRPVGERPLTDFLSDPGDVSKDDHKSGREGAVGGTIKVYLGGPVQPELGLVIHSTDYHRPETRPVTDRLAVTGSKEILRDIAGHKGPAKYLFVLGYAGWGKGQLDGEIARHDWLTAEADPALVFDEDRDAVWQTALARHTREL